MDTTKAITHLSLCSGYEGIGLGLRRVLPNLREIAFVEREGFCVANLVAKMEAGELDSAPVFTDVKQFPYGKFRGQVDILSGGFPCQPFSCAGQRQATEDPRHLFPYIADGIRECKPRIVFLENVQGILSCKTGDGEPVLQYVLRELEGLGYRATAGIFSAEEVGAPHQRKRVFIMGNAKHMRESQPQGSKQDKRGRTQHPSEELVNSNSDGYSKHSETQKEESIWGSEATTMSRSEELADSNNSGRNQDRQPTELRAGGLEQSPVHRWPSRPGEAQQEWEEPRVVVNTKGDNEQRCDIRQGQGELGGSSPGQAQSRLGRASNGSTCGVDATANRVDRLRLLGNGVVPQTATKAFLTLINRLT